MLKKRYIKLTIGDISNPLIFESKMQPKSMRIDFEIKKYANGASYGMNTANVKIYNLNDDTFTTIKKKNLPILIEAGYENEDNIVFNGRINNALRIKENATQPDIVVNLLCSSGIQNIQHFVYTKDFSIDAINSSALQIQNFITNMFKELYYYEDNVKKNIPDLQVVFTNKLDGTNIDGFVRPESFNGSVLDILKYLGQKFNFTFQVEENLVVIRPREMNATLDITPENGLLSIPEITELGLDLKVFLNPRLEAGIVFNLSSKFSNFKLGALEFIDRITTGSSKFNVRELNKFGRYEGTYNIVSLSHKGSSHTNDWQTDITAQNYVLTNSEARQ